MVVIGMVGELQGNVYLHLDCLPTTFSYVKQNISCVVFIQ